MPERSEDVRLMLRGREYMGWSNLEITQTLDSFSTLSFSAPFEPERATFRTDFRPFSFAPMSVTVDGAPLFTGTMLEVAPDTAADARRVGVNAYAKPGVLADVNMPPSAWPLEYNGLRLPQIMERVCAPFGIGTLVDGDVGAAFGRVALEPDGDPSAFLADLARQRGYVLRDAADGRLWATKSVASDAAPVARLEEGVAPVIRVSPAFSPREYYSEITGLGGARSGRPGASATARNERLTGVLRPRVYKPEDTEAGDVPAASRAQLGRMFGACVSYEVPLPTWRTPTGQLWAPNMPVTVLAPGAMVYRDTRMIVRSVTLRKGDEQSCTLGLVLPGVFSSEIPEVMPWD